MLTRMRRSQRNSSITLRLIPTTVHTLYRVCHRNSVIQNFGGWICVQARGRPSSARRCLRSTVGWPPPEARVWDLEGSPDIQGSRKRFDTFFSFCICKISDTICLLVSFLCFVACFHMCRAKSFVHLFACWFDFCGCMCICVLALFFAVFLCCTLMFFLPNWSNLHVLFVCRFHLVALPRFWQLSFTFYSFFVCFRL